MTKRTAKFHTIIYGETAPEVGSTFEKTDCLIVVQKEQGGTDVELLYADGNGKVVNATPIMTEGVDISTKLNKDGSNIDELNKEKLREKLGIVDIETAFGSNF